MDEIEISDTKKMRKGITEATYDIPVVEFLVTMNVLSVILTF